MHKNYGMLGLVITLTILTKVLEWLGQYSYSRQILATNTLHALIQVLFITFIAVILYVGFSYMKVKNKTYLIIPPLAYFLKEVWNFLFVYGRVLNKVTIIALVLEPLVLYILIRILNKYYFKIK